MSTQPKALELAAWIEGEACGGTNWSLKAEQTAAELRRQHAEIERMRESLGAILVRVNQNSFGMGRDIRSITESALEQKQ
jgi:hypothetical protein